jgi:hypothetical protein
MSDALQTIQQITAIVGNAHTATQWEQILVTIIVQKGICATWLTQAY